MQQLIQFFIDQASIDANHLTGMVIAGVLVIIILLVFAGYIFNVFLEFLGGFIRRFKPIQINKVEKVDKIVEVPKYVDNSTEINEILKKIKEIEKNLKKEGVEL